jgi:TPR repeat protein
MKFRSIASCLAIFFLATHVSSSLAQESSTSMKKVALRVEENANWMASAKNCPASEIPQQEKVNYLRPKSCTANPELCLSQCESGKGDFCYILAYDMQQSKSSIQASEALYQRACKLGVMSGCTNRAAGMFVEKANDEASKQCAAKTYSTVCSFDDPWACTMYAFHLIRGIGVKKDLDLALEVLKKSCKYGDEDPACSGAKGLRQEIMNAKRGLPMKRSK